MARPSRDSLFARFEPASRDLARVGGLPTAREAREVWSDIWHLDAHNSTAIEGNTLVLREVEALLERGRAVGAKELRDYLEVLGYGEAAQWVYSQAQGRHAWETDDLITITEVRDLHAQTMRRVSEIDPHPAGGNDEGPGRFRKHDIHPFDGGMTPPPWTDVPAQMRTWTDSVALFGRDAARGLVLPAELPLRLAELHCRFEGVHPFIDGNGRTGRLVLNLVLVRLGWPPAIIFKRLRDRYLTALDRADKGDPGLLAELIARSVLDNLERLVLPNVAGPARRIPLSSLADERISLGALQVAARRGHLEAEIGHDGIWRSSRHAVNRYLKNKHKRS